MNKQLGISNDSKRAENSSDYPEGMLKIYNSSKGRYIKCHNLFLNICLLFCREIWKRRAIKRNSRDLVYLGLLPACKVSRAIYDATLGNYAAGGKFRQREVQKLFQILAHAVTPNDFMLKIDRELFENYTVEQIIERRKGEKWVETHISLSVDRLLNEDSYTIPLYQRNFPGLPMI